MAKLVLATLVLAAGAHADGGYYNGGGYGAPYGGGYGNGYGKGYGKGYGNGYGYGGYYPKATWWKPWTWKYKNYNDYGGYYAPSYHNGSHGPDLDRAAGKYIGLSEILVNESYVAAPTGPQGNGRRRELLNKRKKNQNKNGNGYAHMMQSMGGTGEYTCTCGCAVNEISFGCISYLFDSDGNLDTTLSALQSVYQPVDSSYGSYGDSYEFFGTSQTIFSGDVPVVGGLQVTLQGSTPAHHAGGVRTTTITSTSIAWDVPPAPIVPFTQVRKYGRTSCDGPTAVVNACDAQCDVAVSEGLVVSNEFAAKCVA